MEIIDKHFDNIYEAENYLDELSEQYDSAKCINHPLYSDNGIYTFKVE